MTYVPLVDFLADVLGETCEVLLHDVSTPERSVIAIRNGFHSGRKIGSSLTNLAFKIHEEKSYQNKDFITNYTGKTKGRDFVSSTFYIKNDGELIGMLCLNFDTSPTREFQNAVNQFLQNFCTVKGQQSEEEHITEDLDSSITSIADSIITKKIKEICTKPERMTMKEKISLVKTLNEQGALNVKGAISLIAKKLKISEATVYRYLKK